MPAGQDCHFLKGIPRFLKNESRANCYARKRIFVTVNIVLTKCDSVVDLCSVRIIPYEALQSKGMNLICLHLARHKSVCINNYCEVTYRDSQKVGFLQIPFNQAAHSYVRVIKVFKAH